MNSFTIFNARLIDPATGFDGTAGVQILDGQIADMGTHIDSGDLKSGDIDARGKVLCPGLIDSRVHLSEPGATHLETLEETLAAAVRGGITTLIGLPNTQPVLDRQSSLAYLHQRASQTGLARLHLMGALSIGCEGKDMAELGRLAHEGAVAFSDGARAIDNTKLLYQAMVYMAGANLPFVNLPADAAFSGGQMNAGQRALLLGLKGESPLAETLMLQRDLTLAEQTGTQLVAGLVSLQTSIDLLRGRGQSAATAPHYFLLNEQAVDGYRTFAKTAPPLRTEGDRKAIAQGVAEGIIDLIVSDHRPVDADDKRLPFGETAPGMVGLETLLPLSLTLVHRKLLDLKDLLHRLTARPAEVFGLKTGKISKGAPADLLLFDPNAPILIDAQTLTTRARNISYEHFPAQGKILKTWVGGNEVFSAT